MAKSVDIDTLVVREKLLIFCNQFNNIRGLIYIYMIPLPDSQRCADVFPLCGGTVKSLIKVAPNLET